MPALISTLVDIDEDVSGLKWSVGSIGELAGLIAIIALGQAEHAARIIRSLEPAAPAISVAQLYSAAKRQLRVRGETEAQQEASRHHRDGLT